MAGDVTFTLTEQDYADAARSQYWQRVRSPKQWAWLLPALAVTSALLAYSDSCDLESFLYNLVPYALISVLVCPLLMAFGYAWAGRYARRMFRQQPSKPENTVSWDDAGLRIESALGTLKAEWGDFYGWRSAGRTYMIHMNEALYYLVPEHALSSEQAADLESTLKRGGVVKR
jgi:hypothetical protein